MLLPKPVTAVPHPACLPRGLSLAAGEEWRGRPALSATVRLYDASFFRKVITRHDTGAALAGGRMHVVGV